MYQDAKERYSRYGIDTEAVIAKIKTIPISMNCWQGDDVIGFEKNARALSGGIQTTGDYPGRARTPQELMDDFIIIHTRREEAKSPRKLSCQQQGEG